MIRAAILALLLAAAASYAADDGPWWRGRSGGFEVQWSTQDLVARNLADGKAAYSAAADYAALTTGLHAVPAGPAACSLRWRARPGSLVGPYLGLERNIYRSCPDWVHPAEETTYATYDLSRHPHGAKPAGPARAIALTTLFRPAVIAAALRDNERVRTWMGGAQLPASLDELVQAMSEGAAPSDGECFEVPRDLLQRFVLRGVREGKILVDLGLPGSGQCRGLLTVLSLALEAPRDGVLLRQSEAAQAGRDGTLAPDGASEPEHGRYTEFHRDYRPPR